MLFCFLPWRRFFAAGLSGLSLSDDGLNLREITAVANVRTSSSICVPSAINQRAHVDGSKEYPAVSVLVLVLVPSDSYPIFSQAPVVRTVNENCSRTPVLGTNYLKIEWIHFSSIRVNTHPATDIPHCTLHPSLLFLLTFVSPLCEGDCDKSIIKP